MNMSTQVRFIKAYWLDLLVGVLLLVYVDDIRWFLFYLLVNVIYMADFLRKLIRVYQVANETKYLAIIRKLKITSDEMSIVASSVEHEMGTEKLAALEKEMADLIT